MIYFLPSIFEPRSSHDHDACDLTVWGFRAKEN